MNTREIKKMRFQKVAAHSDSKKGGNFLKPSDSLMRLKIDFVNEARGKGLSEETIRTYEKHLNTIYEFVGYLILSKKDASLDYEESRSECRKVGEEAPISELDRAGLGGVYHQYLEDICYPPLSEQTIISKMRNLRVIARWAMKNNLIANQEITVKTVEPLIKQTFFKEELRRLTSKKPRDKDNNFVECRDWIMVHYLISTGNRIGSMLALNVDDVDFENNEISVQFTKTRTPQIAVLPSKLKPLLANWIKVWRSDENGNPLYGQPLFCNVYGDRLAYKSAYNSLNNYFIERNVDWNGFHKFRHSYAANWIRKGGDSLTLKTQLGHKSLVMTSRYANLYAPSIAQEVEQYGLITETQITNGRKRIKPNK